MLAKMKKFSLVNSQKIFSNWKMLKFCTLFWHIFQKKDLEKIRSFLIRSLIFWIYDPITILWEKRIYDPIQSSKKKDLDPKGSRSNPILQYLSLIHISEPTRPLYISYAVFCLKKKILLLILKKYFQTEKCWNSVLYSDIFSKIRIWKK